MTTPRCSCDVCSEQRLAERRVVEAARTLQRTEDRYGALSPRCADPRRWLRERAREYGQALLRPCLRAPVGL